MTDWADIAFEAGQTDYIERLNTLRTRAAALTDQVGLGYTPENVANKGVAGGYAPLGGDGKVPALHLPSYVDDVEEYADLASFPGTGSAGKIYTALDTGKIYRWSGSVYVELSPSPGSTDAVPEGAANKYFTAARAQAEVAPAMAAAAEKTTPVDADTLGLVDSAAGNALKKLSWAALKATLKTYFDTLYAPLSSALLVSPRLQAYTEKLGSHTLSSGTLTLDCATGNYFAVSLTGNVTSVVFSNVPAVAGTSVYPVTIKFTQDATGGRTVGGWPSAKWPGGTAPTITATAAAVDYVTGLVDEAGVLRLGRSWADSK
jgi:hypothetical protein